MLCEQCQKREATVHVAIVSWPSAELNQHLCEACYPAAEAAPVKPFAALPTAPLPADVEHITATEYLQFEARAAANGADKPAFKQVCRELERFPATRHRLALEFLRMAWQVLERGGDPCFLIVLGGCFGDSTQTGNPPEFEDLLERIVVRSFEGLVQSPKPPSAYPFGFGLSLAVLALRRADSERCATVLARLRESAGEDADRRRIVTDYIEKRIAETDYKRQRRKRDTD